MQTNRGFYLYSKLIPRSFIQYKLHRDIISGQNHPLILYIKNTEILYLYKLIIEPTFLYIKKKKGEEEKKRQCNVNAQKETMQTFSR